MVHFMQVLEVVINFLLELDFPMNWYSLVQVATIYSKKEVSLMVADFSSLLICLWAEVVTNPIILEVKKNYCICCYF